MILSDRLAVCATVFVILQFVNGLTSARSFNSLTQQQRTITPGDDTEDELLQHLLAANIKHRQPRTLHHSRTQPADTDKNSNIDYMLQKTLWRPINEPNQEYGDESKRYPLIQEKRATHEYARAPRYRSSPVKRQLDMNINLMNYIRHRLG